MRFAASPRFRLSRRSLQRCGRAGQSGPSPPLASRRRQRRAVWRGLGFACFCFHAAGLACRVQVWGDRIERSIETGPGEILRHIGEDTLKRSQPAARTVRCVAHAVGCAAPAISIGRSAYSMYRKVFLANQLRQSFERRHDYKHALHCCAAALVAGEAMQLLRCLLALGPA